MAGIEDTFDAIDCPVEAIWGQFLKSTSALMAASPAVDHLNRLRPSQKPAVRKLIDQTEEIIGRASLLTPKSLSGLTATAFFALKARQEMDVSLVGGKTDEATYQRWRVRFANFGVRIMEFFSASAVDEDQAKLITRYLDIDFAVPHGEVDA